MKEIDLVCLFGAGCSANAGLPLANEITDSVFACTPSFRDSIQVWHSGVPQSRSGYRLPISKRDRDASHEINRLIRICADLCTASKSLVWLTPEPVSYEEVFYVLDRLCNIDDMGFDDPFSVSLRNQIFTRFSEEGSFTGADLDQTIRESRRFITDTVVGMLRNEPSSTRYLQLLFRGMAEDGRLSSVVLATTNHDTLIEAALTGAKIGFCDGFRPVGQSEVPVWDPLSWIESQAHLSLLKLHGSIDWYSMMPGEDYNFAWETARFDGSGAVKMPDGRRWRTREPRPRLLIGTLNKTDLYTTFHFSDLFCRFRNSLFNSRHLLVAGFGFRDHGLARLLLTWSQRDRHRRLVLVEPDPRPMRPEFMDILAARVLRIVNKKIEETSWEELRDALFSK